MQDRSALINAVVYRRQRGEYVPRQTNLFIYNGEIKAIGDNRPGQDQTVHDLDGLLLVPGAFDTHCHGGANLLNCTEGRWSKERKRFIYGKNILREAIPEICRAHAEHGTTSLLLSAGATTPARLKNFLEIGGQYAQDGTGNAILEGLDLEGPFLCPCEDGKYAGAQNPAYFHTASIEEYKSVVRGNPYVRRVGVGLEYGRCALDLAQYLAGRKILVGVGHSGASEKDVLELLARCGSMVLIHFGNGPNASNLKPGQARVMEAVAPAIRLANRKNYRVYAEQILDGNHLDNRFTVSVLSLFGRNRILAVTDNVGITVATDIREFDLCGIPAVLSDDGSRAIWVRDREGITLCGSRATTMDHLLPHYLGLLTQPSEEGERGIVGYNAVEPLFESPLSLEGAMGYALDALCLNPAAAYGIDDRIGSIETGKEANLVALKVRSRKPLKISVEHVWVRGKKIK